MTKEGLKSSMADRLRLEMPCRSVLVNLQPIGVGTGFVESLASYFLRLADTHGVTPQSLAREVLFPERSSLDTGRWKALAKAWKYPKFNGIGTSCGNWVESIEALTMVEGLDRLTASPLKKWISTRGLISRDWRWCPACLRESTERGVAYGQLLWSIAPVTACPIHRTRLVSRCGCGPSDACRLGTVKSLPNICPKCAVDLGMVNPQGLNRPSDREVLRSDLVAGLLAHDFANCGRGSNRDLADFLKDSIERYTEGQAVILARRLGVAKSKMHGWIHRDHAPDFVQILNIAEAHGCSLVDVLSGRSEAVTISPMIPLAHREKVVGFKKQHIQWTAVEQGLRQILTDDPPVSLVEAARKIQVSRKSIRRKYPDLCISISKRWMQWQSAKANQRRIGLGEVVRKVALDLATAKVKPTWRRVQEELKKTHTRPSMFMHGYRYYRAIVMEVCREFFPIG